MDDYRIALRMNTDKLDDVVVNDVELFRAEIMDSDALWMCCYPQGTGVPNDRIVFWVRASDGRLEFFVGEEHEGDVSFEPGTALRGKRS